jgi:hypothetical protein
MKELWNYMIASFRDSAKYLKRIKKSQSLREYDAVVQSLFDELELVE